jgi:ABC-2 type transport system permease protein
MRFSRILKASLRQSFIYEMQYRLNLAINMFAGFGWTIISFITVNVIGSNVSTIYSNWTKDEYNLLWAIMFASIGVFSTIFKRNIEKIPEKILKGDLDFTIIKPFNSRLLASLGYIRMDNIPGFIFIMYIAIRSLVNIDNGNLLFFNILLFAFFLLVSTVIMYSLYIGIVTISFWFLGADNLTYFAHMLIMFGNYPVRVFGGALQFFFTFLFPIAFISTFPAESIISLSFIKLLLTILVAIVVYYLTGLLWKLGLRSYSSASS